MRLILFVLVVLTGVAWVADKLVCSRRQRLSAAVAALAEFDARRAGLQGRYGGGGDVDAAR
ncbi:hypothetical protein ACU4GD_02740 [Cupriavidus basilensis]